MVLHDERGRNEIRGRGAGAGPRVRSLAAGPLVRPDKDGRVARLMANSRKIRLSPGVPQRDAFFRVGGEGGEGWEGVQW